MQALFKTTDGVCVDLYQTFDKIADLSLLTKNPWRIYGSLSEALQIDCNGQGTYKTPMSEKFIDLQDYQYIEIITRESIEITNNYIKLYMFVKTDDMSYLDSILDVSNNTVD